MKLGGPRKLDAFKGFWPAAERVLSSITLVSVMKNGRMMRRTSLKAKEQWSEGFVSATSGH